MRQTAQDLIVLLQLIPLEHTTGYLLNAVAVWGELLIEDSKFRREGLGGHYIAGKSPSANEEPGTANLDVDYTFFDQQVWPNVAQRVPGFENIKVFHWIWYIFIIF
jgi:hypothetical protein